MAAKTMTHPFVKESIYNISFPKDATDLKFLIEKAKFNEKNIKFGITPARRYGSNWLDAKGTIWIAETEISSFRAILRDLLKRIQGS